MTLLVNLNQKMPSFIHFREVSGLGRVIARFDPYLSQNTMEGGGSE